MWVPRMKKKAPCPLIRHVKLGAMRKRATRGALSQEISSNFPPCKRNHLLTGGMNGEWNCCDNTEELWRPVHEEDSASGGGEGLFFVFFKYKQLTLTVKSIVFHINETARISLLFFLKGWRGKKKKKKAPLQSIIPDGDDPEAGLFAQTTRLNNTCFHRDNRSVWSKQECPSNSTL